MAPLFAPSPLSSPLPAPVFPQTLQPGQLPQPQYFAPPHLSPLIQSATQPLSDSRSEQVLAGKNYSLISFSLFRHIGAGPSCSIHPGSDSGCSSASTDSSSTSGFYNSHERACFCSTASSHSHRSRSTWKRYHAMAYFPCRPNLLVCFYLRIVI